MNFWDDPVFIAPPAKRFASPVRKGGIAHGPADQLELRTALVASENLVAWRKRWACHCPVDVEHCNSNGALATCQVNLASGSANIQDLSEMMRD